MSAPQRPIPFVIDSDVHHTWKSDADVLAHIPKKWRDAYAWSVSSPNRLHGLVNTTPLLNPAIIHYPHPSGPPRRALGSDYETLKSQLLDPFNIARVILSFDIGFQSGLANPWQAIDVVRAVNDWNLEHWLSIDDSRIRSAVLVQTHVPEAAAEEVHRVGTHPKIAEVLMVTSALGKPFGHPVYHPIYAAAAELGLPVAIHLGGEYIGSYSHVGAGGVPNSRLELEGVASQAMQHHVVSFITHGVFEKFPQLKLLVKEIGIVWIPHLLWSLDANYELLRRESPWVRRLPSEYFRDHIKVTTQPMEIIPAKPLMELLKPYEFVQDILCFSTDYPHWDTDDPIYISRRLPAEWLPKVFFKNALDLYGWDERELLATTTAGAAKQV